MRSFRLTPTIVIVVGTLLCLGIAAAGYFLLVKPKSDDLAAQEARYQPNASYIDPVTGDPNPTPLAQANSLLQVAKVQANIVTKQWDTIQDTKNPYIDYSDRWKSWLEWTSEAEYDFAPRLNSFLRHTGVTPLTTIGAPGVPNDPNKVPTGLLAAPLPTIAVFGSYDQILNHVASWNRFSRIVLVDGLSLKGYSPFMTGTYSATEYIFTRHSDSPGPPVPTDPTVTGAVVPKPAGFEQMPGFNGKAP